MLWRLNQRHRLAAIRDEAELQARITETCSDFDREVGKFRRTKFARRFRFWLPVAWGAVVTVAGATVALSGLGPAGMLITLPLQAVGLSLTVIDKSGAFERAAGPEQQTYRMIADIRREIAPVPVMRRLLGRALPTP